MSLASQVRKLNNKHFLSFAGNGIMAVLGMVTMGLLYRAFPTKAETGIWVFFQTVIILLDTFRSGFITTAFVKFYAGSSEQRKQEVVGSTWAIALLITGILIALNLIIYFLFPATGNDGLNLFFKWFGITYVCTLPYFMSNCVLQGEQRFDRLLYARFINTALFIIFVCMLLYFHNVHLQTVVYANLAASLITSLFVLFAGWTRVLEFARRTKACTIELYHFGKYSVGTNISSVLLNNSDTFIINFMLGPAQLAIYNLGRKWLEIIEIPLRSTIATAMPTMSAAYNQHKKAEVIYIMKKYCGTLTLLLVPVVMFAVVFANIAITVIGGGKYAGTEATNVFRIFMTFALLFPADRFFGLTIDVIHQPRINFIKVLVMLAANIITDFIGIYIFGNIYGVALASIFPTMIAVGVGYWTMRKYYPFAFTSVYTLGYAEIKILFARTLQRFKTT